MGLRVALVMALRVQGLGVYGFTVFGLRGLGALDLERWRQVVHGARLGFVVGVPRFHAPEARFRV